MAGTLAPLDRLASLFDAPKDGGNSRDAIKRRRALADALAQQASDPSGGGGSMLGAIGQGLKGLAAGLQRDRADRDELAGQREAAALLGRVGLGGPSPAPAPAMGAPQGLATPAGMSAGASPKVMPSGSGHTNPQEVYGGLVSRGVPSMVAAGMVGNIAGESNFKLGVADGRGEGSVGLIQARGSRLASLRDLGASTGRDPYSLDNQLDHIVGEFQGPEKRAFQLASGAKSPGDAAYILAKHYERPADWALRESAPKRMDAAEQVYRQAGPQAAADMPAAGAEPVSFLTEPRDPNGGFFIPPADRAAAPAGDPSGPRPGDMPAPATSPEIAALMSREPMGPAQSFVPPAGAGPAEMTVPLPPARPSPADLQVAPPEPSVAQATAPVPAPAAAAPDGPQAMTVPLPPQRPSDAALMTPNPADMPAPRAVPTSGTLAIDPNSRDAGAGVFARRQGIDALLGGLQDGLDGIFGGPETKARLERQAAVLGGPAQVSPQALRRADVLANGPAASAPAEPSAGAGPGRAAYAQALGGTSEANPQAQRLASVLDPSGARGPVPASAVPQPTAYAQAGGGMPDARRQDLLALANSEYATPQVRQMAIDQLNPKLNHVDMGDSIGFVDQGGNMVRAYPKTRAPMNVSEGSTLVDPNTGRPIFTAPPKNEQTPDQKNYVAAQQGGYRGTFNDFVNQRTQRQGQAVTVKDASGNERTLFYDPVENRLRTPEEMGAPAASAPTNPFTPGGKGMTEEQAKSAGFAGRMTTSHATINDLEQVGTGAIEAGIAKIPGSNAILSTGKQRLQQAQSDFVNSLLRRESGAAISRDEFDRYGKQYFPQPGDKPEVIEAKRRSREDALEGVFTSAGPNYRVPEGYKRTAPREGDAPSAPSAAVQALRSDPRLQEQFEAKYGKGSAAHALGGR